MSKKEKVLPRIMQPKKTYTVDYPQAIEASEKQAAIIWFATELGVEKDEHDIRTKMTFGEREGLIEVSRMFNHYENSLGGDEFWGGKVAKMFPRPEIVRMASTFSFVELGIHAPFYDLINKTMGIATDEFYNEWKLDPVLVERMAFIDEYANSKDPLIFTAAFAFMEGAVIFSNMAYIKSLNTRGWNMCSHFAAGIDASAKDENFHSMASAWLFNQTLTEMTALGTMTPRKLKSVHKKIYAIAQKVFEHESKIIENIFSKGEIRTITKEEMIEFVMNRIDQVLSYLGMKPLYGIPQGTVSDWFYTSLSAYKYSDFFANQQIQYVRDWNKSKLVFKSTNNKVG